MGTRSTVKSERDRRVISPSSGWRFNSHGGSGCAGPGEIDWVAKGCCRSARVVWFISVLQPVKEISSRT